MQMQTGFSRYLVLMPVQNHTWIKEGNTLILKFIDDSCNQSE